MKSFLCLVHLLQSSFERSTIVVQTFCDFCIGYVTEITIDLPDGIKQVWLFGDNDFIGEHVDFSEILLTRNGGGHNNF